MTYNPDNSSFWFCGNGGNIEVYGDVMVNTKEKFVIQENNIISFPNPGTNLLQIQWDSDEVLRKVVVIDAVGRLLYQSEKQNHFQSTISVSTASWVPGMYFILVETSDQLLRGTWVKGDR